MPKRKSVIRTLTRDTLVNLVNSHRTLVDILRYLGMSASGTSYALLKKRFNAENIDYSHMLAASVAMICIGKEIPFEEVFREDSLYNNRGGLKKKLLKQKIIENKCSICGMDPFWNGKALVMILDHKNGIPNDNRVENLRLVCPNCNMQLPTTNGRNRRRVSNCLKCGTVVNKRSKFCVTCASQRPQMRQRKVALPRKDVLESLVGSLPFTQIGKKYGVSDNAVRKWCCSYGIDTKLGRGYWTQKKAVA
jgi:hypothetical protein